jgi:hypothetical protein
MSTAKPSRRKSGAKKLEPIDWHEFANDAVLNGNMSTLYHRPATEDPTTYASPEALVEIEKRVGRPVESAVFIDTDLASPDAAMGPTVGPEHPVGTAPAVGFVLPERPLAAGLSPDVPTAGGIPTVGPTPTIGLPPTAGVIPTVGLSSTETVVPGVPPVAEEASAPGKSSADSPDRVVEAWDSAPPARPNQAVSFAPKLPAPPRLVPTAGLRPTVGLSVKRKVKPIRDVQDALTLAGQVLYRAMYGAPDGARSKSCTKGYRQLAAETHLDKDTVRDLIAEFKDRGMVREIGTYDPDTRSAKTYEVLSYKAILQLWRDAGLGFVTAGRQRPAFCTAQGEPVTFKPTVGLQPIALRGSTPRDDRPTVGPMPAVPPQTGTLRASDVIQVLQQITGGPVDQEAVDRLIQGCRASAADCTVEEIVEFAWSKAFLCRSGKIENPLGFLITQIPKYFQGEAFQAYRDRKRHELEAAARMAAREEERRRESVRELEETEERQQFRRRVAERHRKGQGIDLTGLLQDSEADGVLKEWAKRLLNLGHRYRPEYD